MSSQSERLPDPLGPFNVVDTLRSREGSRTTLSLSRVVFKQRNDLVGLDIADNKHIRERGPMFFMGILKLSDANRACLTEEGGRCLRHEISRRLGRPGEQYFDSPEFTAKVKLYGELLWEPRGLDSSDLFTIVARDTPKMIEHEFIVQSLHVETYTLSRSYLLKWKLLRQIISISKQDERTPVGARTPRWFASKYLESSTAHFQARQENASLAPRKVHRAEVYSLLARHCRWLLEKICKAPSLVNTTSWKEFVLQVETRMNSSLPLEDRFTADCDELEKSWPEEDELSPEIHGQASQNHDMGLEYEIPEHNFQHTYRQVAGGQTNGDHATRQTLPEDEETEMYTRSDVLAALPEVLLFQEPTFPTGSKWNCPVNSCDYVVILRDIHRMNFEWMDEDDRNFLRSGHWGPTNDRAIELFNDIVESHFYHHLRVTGIRHVACRYLNPDAMGNSRYELIELNGPRQVTPEYDRFKFEWIKPHHH